MARCRRIRPCKSNETTRCNQSGRKRDGSSRAVQLLQDDWFFEMVDLRDHVGKRSNQQRRIRGRIIGSEGKIRKMIEFHTNTEISIYKSTVVLVGEGLGLSNARQAIEMLASGDEHGTVLKYLERERKKFRMESVSLDYIEVKNDEETTGSEFSNLVLDCPMLLSEETVE